MADVAKLLRDLLPALNDVFDQEFLSSGTIQTNLPADNFGFWLTQGVPFGLIFIHLLMAVLGERDVGRCFVPKVDGEALMQSQIQYITEMCLDQATHYECFDQSSGDVNAVCGSSPCDGVNETLDSNVTIHDQSKTSSVFETLFFYRYYVWFLVAFTFLRALPQIVWKLSYTADVRKAIQDIATIAEFQHAMCGVMSLVSGDKYPEMSTGMGGDNCPKWMQSMNRIVLDEVSKRASRNVLFRAYVIRKVADICLDMVIITTFIWFQCDRTPFDDIVFVCDLHGDRDNIFLCESIQRRFVPCTVSFGFEFIITAFLVFCVMVIDLVVQLYVTLVFTRIGHLIIRKMTFGSLFSGKILYWDPFISQELELTQNNQWVGFDQSFMLSPNDLYLVGLMYRQSNVNHGHFLKMMAEKMLEQLRPAFDYLRQTSNATSNPMTTFRSNSHPADPSNQDDQPRDDDESDQSGDGAESGLERTYPPPMTGFDFPHFENSGTSQYSASYSRL